MRIKKVHFTKQWSLVMMFISASFQSCESFLEVELPKSRMVSEGVYRNEGTALAAISGIYYKLISGAFASGFQNSVTLLSGFSSDELVNYYDAQSYTQFYQNQIIAANSANNGIWSSCYEVIYAANAVIEGVQNSVSLSNDTKVQLEGEARFVRAFCYFYLVNLYNDVPLALTTDYRVNSAAPRTAAAEVYASIVADLVKAKELLSAGYPSVERVRPNKAAATALLARAYLYLEDWEHAEEQASMVIDDSQYSLAADLNQAFLANSDEAVWQMIVPGYNTWTNEGSLFILTSIPNFSTPAALADTIVASFEPGDLRKANWVGSYVSGGSTFYFSWKYKNRTGGTPVSEYSMVLRLAEQFLIRAEARAQQDKLAGAVADLDSIRSRAQIPLIRDIHPGIGQDDLLLAIEQERKVELFAEWGHRWLDLKRTGRANALLSIKPTWDPTDVWYPIPEREILNDPNLKPQNPGY